MRPIPQPRPPSHVKTPIRKADVTDHTEPVTGGESANAIRAVSARPLPPSISMHPLYERLSDASDRISEREDDYQSRVYRARAILHLMQFRYEYRDSLTDDLDRDTIMALLTLMLDTLPVDAPDVRSPSDDLGRVARQTLCDALAHCERQRVLLDAMTVAANFGATFDELDVAAQRVWDTSHEDPSFESNWRQFRDVIRSRGCDVQIAERSGHTHIQVVIPRRAPPTTHKIAYVLNGAAA